MKKIGIICEYNPFHSGHAYQIAQIRRKDPDAAIVCLMSGHATQRGETAIADRYTRANMAVTGGANVVLELPYPYSAASAAYFAGAGVAILDALGMEALSFGSECADPELLSHAAELTQAPDFIRNIRDRQRKGEGSAQAYFSELQAQLGVTEGRFLANDILAIEYVRAIRAIDSEMRSVPIERRGSAYAENMIEAGKHPSATALRECLVKGDVNDALRFFSENAKKELKCAIDDGFAPATMRKIDSAMLAFFRLTAPEALEEIAEMQGGLAYRLHDAAMRATSFEEMMTLASAKSYPTARLRRAILFAMTGVTTRDLTTPPGYLALLAADDVGRGLLRAWKGNTPIPIVTKPADAPALSAAAARQATLTQALDALFAMTLPSVRSADTFVKMSPRTTVK